MHARNAAAAAVRREKTQARHTHLLLDLQSNDGGEKK
jgi:hypothetical protein